MLKEIECYGLSDIGHVRANNEDLWIELPEYQFYALADGMGGHNAGEVAAKEAILELCDAIDKLFIENNKPSIEKAKQGIKQGVCASNRWVRSLSKEHSLLSGMGTTLCCTLILQETLIYTHLGDSRIYLFRKKLKQLSEDHTSTQQIFDPQTNQIRLKTVITQAIGTSSHVDPLIHTLSLENDDLILLCSDGLSDHLSDKEIEQFLKEPLSLKDLAHHLVDEAKEKGGKDNITVVLIRFKK